jgi:hypothetical protein
MNPQDVRTNADRLRVRDDYLKVLRQQEANLQKTANALSVMVQTGQPPIAPSDMRTATEKLGDIERLKPMFRKQLTSLMEAKEADVVMNVLDNAEIQSAVMIFGEISSQLSGKYPLGIPAPIFIEYLRRFLRDYDKTVGFTPKSKEERDILEDAGAIEGTQQYMRFQQQQLDQEMENTQLAQDIRNEESRNRIAENQMQERYYEAFDISTPREIAETARIITGNDKVRPSTLRLAKRVLGFDNLTPDEIFTFTNPTKEEIVLYLQYDYFRNFGERFSRAESDELFSKDMDELQEYFTRIRGGDDTLQSGTKQFSKETFVRETGMMGSEDYPAQSSISATLAQGPTYNRIAAATRRFDEDMEAENQVQMNPRRRQAEQVGLEESRPFGNVKSKVTYPQISSNPTVAEISEVQLELGPNATVAEITEAVKRRGRPAKYATAEEARLAKLQQTKESKQRTQAQKLVIKEVELFTQNAMDELVAAFNKSARNKEDRKALDRAVGIIQRQKQNLLEERLAEAGLPSPVKASKKIPAFSGAAEFQGLSAVSQPFKEESSSSSSSTSNIPPRLTISADEFRKANYLIKTDLIDLLTRTELFRNLDSDLQQSIRDNLEYATYPSASAPITQDEALENLNIAFESLRNNEIRRITGTGMGFLKAKATGAAKHTKNLIVGRGLQAKAEKPKREFADKIDTSISTLPENKSYVPFGKYVLNRRRLNDNKLMVRTVKGGAISGIPTLAISPVLGGIIKKMVGGALPSYNEMSNLSEEEQNTLYKIFKISEVDNADLLPAPNKSKEEEEMNRFQILKGQVLAGNDSKELIKEFKVMLLKFIHNGKVPKGQGMDIICDLMAMGY